MTSDLVPVPRDALEKLVAVARHVSLGARAAFVQPYPDATARFALGGLDDAGLLVQFVPRCVWPDCLTSEQQRRLAEDVERTDRGEDPVIEPDQRLVCGCVDLGLDDDLGPEFEVHAEEPLALANEAFDAAVETWPEE